MLELATTAHTAGLRPPCLPSRIVQSDQSVHARLLPRQAVPEGRGWEQGALAKVLCRDVSRFQPVTHPGAAFDGCRVESGLSGRAKLDDRLPEAIDFANHLKESKGYSKVSILGYCWGELATLRSH